MSLDPMIYRQVVGNFATGVVVVTAGKGDKCHAVTVNSFTSVSLDPTLILVCLTTDSRTRAEILDSKLININVLRDDQEELSRYFARPQEDQAWVEEFKCFEGQWCRRAIPESAVRPEVVV